MNELTASSSLDALSKAGTAILLKHGATCPISAHAREEVSAFARSHPDLPVYALEVTANPALSRDVSSRLRIAHESPQVFVLQDGRVKWQATHYDITAERIEREVG